MVDRCEWIVVLGARVGCVRGRVDTSHGAAWGGQGLHMCKGHGLRPSSQGRGLPWPLLLLYMSSVQGESSSKNTITLPLLFTSQLKSCATAQALDPCFT